MNKAAVTDWIDGRLKPVRAGVYERRIPHCRGSSFWFFNGSKWIYGGYGTPNQAPKSGWSSEYQALPWRGLAADPKQAKK